MKMYLVASLFVVFALLGCSCEVKLNEKNETDMGSHHVVVKPHSTFTSRSSSSGGVAEVYQYTSGDVSVEIRNEELVVNNVRYGELMSGVAVLIDHGVVTVDGQKREGTPMSEQEITDAAPVKESTAELDGYTVTVRPGSSFTSTIQIFGRHTLTVGKTKVSIKNDELIVNGTPYGNLTKDDIILVEQGSVIVSGEDRKPKE